MRTIATNTINNRKNFIAGKKTTFLEKYQQKLTASLDYRQMD